MVSLQMVKLVTKTRSHRRPVQPIKCRDKERTKQEKEKFT